MGSLHGYGIRMEKVQLQMMCSIAGIVPSMFIEKFLAYSQLFPNVDLSASAATWFESRAVVSSQQLQASLFGIPYFVDLMIGRLFRKRNVVISTLLLMRCVYT